MDTVSKAGQTHVVAVFKWCPSGLVGGDDGCVARPTRGSDVVVSEVDSTLV
jgi:hypothetical protein